MNEHQAIQQLRKVIRTDYSPEVAMHMVKNILNSIDPNTITDDMRSGWGALSR